MLCLEDPPMKEDAGMAEEGRTLNDVTLGEVYRKLEEIRSDLGRFVARDVHEEQMRGVNARLSRIESSQQWQARTLAGLVVTVLGALIVFWLTKGSA